MGSVLGVWLAARPLLDGLPAKTHTGPWYLVQEGQARCQDC
jgi:hypothetical protein